MKVLMTADNVGGVWTYAVDLATGLTRVGVDVALAVMGHPVSDQQRASLGRGGVTSLYASGCTLEWMPDPWGDVDMAGEWLLQIAEAERPDVVHLNSYAHAALPWERPVVVVAHSDVRSWWRAVHGSEAPKEWDAYSARVKSGLDAATAIVAPTAAMLSQLHEVYRIGVPSRVIHNGRDTTDLYPAEKEDVIFAAGRLWDEAKNVTILEHAAPSCRWPIYAAGERHTAGNELVYLGSLEAREIKYWLRRASIFCAPARYEPFGLTTLEAAICGCALVLGDIASLREVWDDAAIFVEPNDARALAGALNWLAEDGSSRDAMARRARRRARRYSLEKMVDDYVRLYRSVATSRETPVVGADA